MESRSSVPLLPPLAGAAAPPSEVPAGGVTEMIGFTSRTTGAGATAGTGDTALTAGRCGGLGLSARHGLRGRHGDLGRRRKRAPPSAWPAAQPSLCPICRAPPAKRRGRGRSGGSGRPAPGRGSEKARRSGPRKPTLRSPPPATAYRGRAWPASERALQLPQRERVQLAVGRLCNSQNAHSPPRLDVVRILLPRLMGLIYLKGAGGFKLIQALDARVMDGHCFNSCSGQAKLAAIPPPLSLPSAHASPPLARFPVPGTGRHSSGRNARRSAAAVL